MLQNLIRLLKLTTLSIAVVGCFLKTTSGQYATLQPCPRINGMPNFNISQYSGLWYEVEKYWFVVEATSSCVSVRYSDNRDGTFGVEISQIEGITRTKMVNPGITWYQSRDGSADFILDLLVTQSPLPFRFRYPYLVLDTDYTTYTIKYRCKQIGPLSLQNMWVLSRTKNYLPESRKAVHNYLRRVGLNVDQLRQSNLNTCPITEEE